MMPHSIGSPGLWLGFIAFVMLMLALDLGMFHRRSHTVHYKEALAWSAVWIALSMVFAGGVWWFFGAKPGMEFLTGYLIEKSLSVDNLFVFVLVFSAFKVPLHYQHRILYWGITTALFLRAAMILAGTALLARFHWMFYVFGAFLVFTGAKLLFTKDKDEDPKSSWIMQGLRKILPMTPSLESGRFFTVENGKRLATPLFMALVLVEISDIIFALDSIPAIFAVTLDPFIVFTSNIFAILGLRSLYFLLADAVDKLRYLKHGIAAVLVFVGVKMLVAEWWTIASPASLLVVLVVLGGATGFSLLKTADRRK